MLLIFANSSRHMIRLDEVLSAELERRADDQSRLLITFRNGTKQGFEGEQADELFASLRSVNRQAIDAISR